MSGEEPTEVGDWVKQRVLGSGGFGVVTLWKHKAKDDQMIALKKCRWGTDQLLTPKHKERWSKEVEIMQRLSHPNVVRAVTVPPELQDALKSELPMLCMEFCTRGDLRQVLNRSENCCGLLEPEVRALISDISSAVKYLHYMKITHRDLKPENIVLQSGEQRVSYKLIDLGYAKELDQSSICTSFVGTLQYLAPELFMNKNYSCSVDYWSLGLVSHEVITGVRPFLPSMAPVSWMSHVGNKSGDDICAHQASDGTIVFGKELFPQNHISSCLKYYMEKWLKACLEWDAKKRGRYNKEADGEIIVFNMIDDILNKTMLNVYDAMNYQMLSYEIEHSTAVKTLQRWIERDTGLIIEKQELLLPDGSSVDLEKEAWLCISTHNLKPQEPRVFVYKRGTLSVPEVTPQIPASVSAMMQDPRSLVAYAQQIRSYAHAVFFLDQEQRLYKTFRHAAAVKLLRLCNSSNSLRQELSSVNMLMHQTEAQHSLNDTALEFDESHALKLSAFSVNVVQGWKKRNGLIRRQLEKLKEAVDHLKVRCESHFRKTRELGSSASDIENVDLQSSLKAAMASYESLKRRPKEKRHQQSDSVEMVKIVYNCLKTRDKLLRDESLNAYLRRIVTLQEDIGKLIGPVHSCAEMVNRIQTDVSKAFRERQTEIWNHFLQICNQSKDTATSGKPSLMHSSQSLSNLPKFSHSSEPSFNNASTESLSTALPSPAQTPPALPPKPPTPVFKVGPPIPNGQVAFNRRGGNTADDMINDNIALRYATQDLMQESFAHYRSLLEENRSLDWSFMK